ncbi:MAG: hypothetical protein M1839_002697 [Geoglossum umbratile]|nr:MAG: hypothetical protein M1839_002697 [Geoglossum umbratile]
MSEAVLFTSSENDQITVAETPLALAAVASRRFSHPDIRRFLQPHQKFEVATSAYNLAVEALATCLSPDELTRVQSPCTVHEVHALAEEAQRLCEKKVASTKIERFLQVLHHYSRVVDMIPQHHMGYASLIWGTMRWLLQVSMNYFNLLHKLSAMLGDIGRNLPRFFLYQHILSTDHMASIISELYAVIVGFLHNAIVFFRKNRLRKYFSAFWSPFEIKFRDSVERIQQLQVCVENDAHATAIIQQQADNTALARQLTEMSLVMRRMVIPDYSLPITPADDDFPQILFRAFAVHLPVFFQIRTSSLLVLTIEAEIKEGQAAILLVDLRKFLFSGSEWHATFYQDFLDHYKHSTNPEWDFWAAEEMRLAPWTHTTKSQLRYVQTDSIQPQLYGNDVAYGYRLAGSGGVFTHYIWTSGATARSVVASLICQILQQRPDKLLKNPPDFYLWKFKNGGVSFDKIWSIFLELISTLPSFICMIQVLTVGPEETRFVARFLEWFQSWTGPVINVMIASPTHPSFPRLTNVVDLDDVYDVNPALETSDALCQVILAEYNRNVSVQIWDSLWDTLWRTIRYTLSAMALKEVVVLVESAVGNSLPQEAEPGCSHDSCASKWWGKLENQRRLKAMLQEGPLREMTYTLPCSIRKRLQLAARLEIEKATALQSEAAPNISPFDSSNNFDKTHPSSEFKLLSPQARAFISSSVQSILEAAIQKAFHQYLYTPLKEGLGPQTAHIDTLHPSQNHTPGASSQPHTRSEPPIQYLDKVLFDCELWVNASCTMARDFEEAITTAIEVGLSNITRTVIVPKLGTCGSDATA